jgi:hypothetical protein
VQALAGASLETAPKSPLPIEFVSGSSFCAALVSPAESRRLEIVPSAIRLIVFIEMDIPRLFVDLPIQKIAYFHACDYVNSCSRFLN